MSALIAGECSGAISQAMRKLGYEAWSCDLKPSEVGSRWHITGDWWRIISRGWSLIIIHPVCNQNGRIWQSLVRQRNATPCRTGGGA